MKPLSEKEAIGRLSAVREAFRLAVREGYEHRAISCETCTTKGACCLDAHFVNVHILRLEAAAIAERLAEFPEEKLSGMLERIRETVRNYGLDKEGDTWERTFACPLYEKDAGCLVHDTAKPLPCIAHACYENKSDIPPDELLSAAEQKAAHLDARTYSGGPMPEPLPVAVLRRFK